MRFLMRGMTLAIAFACLPAIAEQDCDFAGYYPGMTVDTNNEEEFQRMGIPDFIDDGDRTFRILTATTASYWQWVGMKDKTTVGSVIRRFRDDQGPEVYAALETKYGDPLTPLGSTIGSQVKIGFGFLTAKARTTDTASWYDAVCGQRIEFIKVGQMTAGGGAANTTGAAYLVVSATDDLRGSDLID